MTRILVVNPNSSERVTAAIREALSVFGPYFDVIGTADGPDTVRSAADVARAGLAFAHGVAAHPEADAYVSACFSDPGVEIARPLTGKPVIGLQEAAVMTALARADRFGILALSEAAIPRHRLRLRAMGVLSRLAGEVALPGLSAAESGEGRVLDLAEAKAGALRQAGAEILVLGCAGMSPIGAALERRTGMPVVDPVLAAGALALGSCLGRSA
ncbi:aspartate/glutamate racemase family protein [Celeribacter indicus]|uniref:Asp/Glu/Hydantoin racemase superfamily protein n=1 Tax=Celeribacter indicus TaxID=1208324 RepID=A0A0B5E5E9_9RHOB|nr:aspartate/glutamate racemase family protein [Celeribacter indicus]AJE47577.1 Asp/Glu/Hydantoin racemase superfamily protein [Celeribacter indicus]SDW10764.1 Asp/Glu/hydantoin racemase [Celeribacter indicus]